MSSRLVDLDFLPEERKEALCNYLSDLEQLSILKEQLSKTPIIIDDGEYQISIRNIKELYEIKDYLKHKCIPA